MKVNKRLEKATLAPVAAAMVTVGLVVGSTVAVSQQGSSEHPMTPQEMQQMRQEMMEMRDRMMNMREQLMADVDAADTRLQELVDQMNASEGTAKIDAMAELLTELTTQHTARMQMGQMMMPGMMQMMGMMDHMGSDMEHMMRERRGAGSQ